MSAPHRSQFIYVGSDSSFQSPFIPPVVGIKVVLRSAIAGNGEVGIKLVTNAGQSVGWLRRWDIPLAHAVNDPQYRLNGTVVEVIPFDKEWKGAKCCDGFVSWQTEPV